MNTTTHSIITITTTHDLVFELLRHLVFVVCELFHDDLLSLQTGRPVLVELGLKDEKLDKIKWC